MSQGGGPCARGGQARGGVCLSQRGGHEEPVSPAPKTVQEKKKPKNTKANKKKSSPGFGDSRRWNPVSPQKRGRFTQPGWLKKRNLLLSTFGGREGRGRNEGEILIRYSADSLGDSGVGVKVGCKKGPKVGEGGRHQPLKKKRESGVWAVRFPTGTKEGGKVVRVTGKVETLWTLPGVPGLESGPPTGYDALI